MVSNHMDSLPLSAHFWAPASQLSVVKGKDSAWWSNLNKHLQTEMCTLHVPPCHCTLSRFLLSVSFPIPLLVDVFIFRNRNLPIFLIVSMFVCTHLNKVNLM